jgi:hypothetical protein
MTKQKSIVVLRNTALVFIAVIFYFLVFRGSVFAQSNAPSSAPVRSPGKALSQPSIAISPDYFYPPEEILYIEGRSEPNVIINVSLQKQGEQPLKFTVQADNLGEWVLAEKVFLNSGNWEVRARTQDGDSVSEWSNPRVIRSIVSGINILGISIRYLTLGAVGILLLGAFILIYIFVFRKIHKRDLKRVRELRQVLLRHKLTETEEKLHHRVSEIREDLLTELKGLTSRGEKALTEEQRKRREHILRELEELEKDVSHEIGDIVP